MIDAVVTGFYTKLATYHDTYEAYNILAPQDAALPYITFGIETDRPVGVFGSVNQIEDLTFWVNCFSKTGRKHCRQVADMVLAVMDDASLTVTGYNPMRCTREFIGAPMWNEPGVWQIPLRIRVQLSK